MSEGQQLLVRAAKHCMDRWKQTPIRQADINDKLAADKLIWLVHNFDFEQFDEAHPCESFEIPTGDISEAYICNRDKGYYTHSR